MKFSHWIFYLFVFTLFGNTINEKFIVIHKGQSKLIHKLSEVDSITFIDSTVDEDNMVLSLDGYYDYLEFRRSIFPSAPDDFTVSLWFYADSSTGTPTEVLFNGLYQELEIGIDRQPNTLHCGIKMNDGYHFFYTEYRLKQWTFVAITFNKRTGLFKCYKDGELFATSDLSGLLPHSVTTAGLGTYTYRIGLETDFHGLIDEFRVWGVARTQEQIVTTMNDTLSHLYYATPDSSLTGYWRFDGNPYDRTQTNNHGILRGNAHFVKKN
jgi:hypothetical protein